MGYMYLCIITTYKKKNKILFRIKMCRTDNELHSMLLKYADKVDETEFIEILKVAAKSASRFKYVYFSQIF